MGPRWRWPGRRRQSGWRRPRRARSSGGVRYAVCVWLLASPLAFRARPALPRLSPLEPLPLRQCAEALVSLTSGVAALVGGYRCRPGDAGVVPLAAGSCIALRFVAHLGGRPDAPADETSHVRPRRRLLLAWRWSRLPPRCSRCLGSSLGVRAQSVLPSPGASSAASGIAYWLRYRIKSGRCWTCARRCAARSS